MYPAAARVPAWDQCREEMPRDPGRCFENSRTRSTYKVNFRPDGFEIVLADEALSADGLSGDPFYERLAAETYNGAPLCDRSVPAVLETACYQNAVFEILPNNFPEVCGDNLLTP